MNRKPAAADLLRRIPTKWAVGIIAILIGYTLLQPMLNQRLGWSLPSTASLLGQDSPSAAPGETDLSPGNSQSTESGAGRGGTLAAEQDSQSASDQQLRYGLLRDVGDQDFVSPGGLIYGRGSREGHRLKHLERHLEDQPQRPGKHGVFYRDMPQVLRWLDDTFTRAEAGASGTSRRSDDGRTVMEASFDKPVGYVGGRDGGRSGNPDARQIRLVVEGKRVITAFPF